MTIPRPHPGDKGSIPAGHAGHYTIFNPYHFSHSHLPPAPPGPGADSLPIAVPNLFSFFGRRNLFNRQSRGVLPWAFRFMEDKNLRWKLGLGKRKIKIFWFSNKKHVPLQSDYYPNLRKFEWRSWFLWPGIYALLLFKCLIIKIINGGYFKL